MLGARHRLAALGTGVALVATLAGTTTGAPATPPNPTRAKTSRAFLIHLINGGDPIVVEKYTEQGGEIRFEKYGGWVSIPSYEVLRIVPDDSEETSETLPPPTPPGAAEAPLYVATRSGATVRASNVDARGPDVRVSTPEGSLTFHRTDLVGVLRVPAAPAPPEAWITVWGADDGSGGRVPPADAPDARRPPSLTLSDRPHLLELANGVVIQVDGFWLEAGEIRFRRLGGVVGFALNEIARLLPQETEPVRGRLPARFVRRLGPDRVEVRLPEGVKPIRLIGIDPDRERPRPRGPVGHGRSRAPRLPRVRPRALRAGRGLAGLPLPAEWTDAQRRADPRRARRAARRDEEYPLRRPVPGDPGPPVARRRTLEVIPAS